MSVLGRLVKEEDRAKNTRDREKKELGAALLKEQDGPEKLVANKDYSKGPSL